MRKTLRLKKFRFQKRAFKKAPKNEQVLFLRALDILTEISTLRRAMFFAANRKKLPKNIKSLVITAQTIQVFYFERVLAGVLYESSKFIEKFQKLEPNLNKKRKAFHEVFSKSKFLKGVRNRFAYHYDYEVIENNLKKIIEASSPILYLTSSNLNSFYLFGNQAIACALAKDGGYDPNNADDLARAYRQIHKEIKETSETTIGFLTAFICQFLEKYLNIDLSKLPISKIGKLQMAKDIFLPYFAVWD